MMLQLHDHVAIAPHLDSWMQGLRYGQVVAVTTGDIAGVPVTADVRFRNGRVRRFHVSALTVTRRPVRPAKASA